MAQLSLTEVSKRFNVNRTTIYRAVNSGKLSRLSNGLFDLAEVIRVFGEVPAPVQDVPASNEKDREIIALLKSQIEMLNNQLEKKDSQIDHLQRLLVAPETSAQRPEATTCNDTETPISQGLKQDSNTPEANSNDTKQHDATARKRGLFDRLDRGLKAFLK